MRKAMRSISWLVFLAFIGLSSYANYLHGSTPHARIMLAVVPVGFAASVFIFEGLITQGRVSWWTFGAIGFVALASGVASYLGLFGMARDSGVPLVQSLLLPLSFDGVVLVSSMGIRGFSLHVPAPRPRATRTAAARPAPDAPQDTTGTEASAPMSRPLSAPVPQDDRVAKALAMLAEGRDKADVAETIGCTVRTLNRWIKSTKETTTDAQD